MNQKNFSGCLYRLLEDNRTNAKWPMKVLKCILKFRSNFLTLGTIIKHWKHVGNFRVKDSTLGAVFQTFEASPQIFEHSFKKLKLKNWTLEIWVFMLRYIYPSCKVWCFWWKFSFPCNNILYKMGNYELPVKFEQW